MFFNKKAKVVTHVVDAMTPMISLVTHNFGVPQGFWTDEFVLGFTGLAASFHMTETSGYRTSTADKGEIIAEVYSQLSMLNGIELGRRFSDLTREVPPNPEFQRGGDNAYILCNASLGKYLSAGQNEILEAKSRAEREGNINDPSAMLNHLLQLLFIEPIKLRFELEA